MGWWRIHGNGALELHTLVVHSLSQISLSSANDRNWTTYSFIHPVKRNIVTSKRVDTLVVVHSALHLHHRKTREYLQGLTTRQDIYPKDVAQIDGDDQAKKEQKSVSDPVTFVGEDGVSDSDIDGDSKPWMMEVEDQSVA